MFAKQAIREGSKPHQTQENSQHLVKESEIRNRDRDASSHCERKLALIVFHGSSTWLFDNRLLAITGYSTTLSHSHKRPLTSVLNLIID